MALEADVDELDINKVVHVTTGFKNLVDHLDVDKLNTVPVDLKKLRDILSKKVAKKAVYNKLYARVKNLEDKIPDATTSTSINQHNTDKQSLDKVLDTSGLVTNAILDTKLGKVEDKIPNFSSLLKKTFYNAKISDNEKKQFITSNYNKFTGGKPDTKIKEKRLVDNSSVSDLIKNSDVNTKLATLATKVELKAQHDQIVKL